MDVDEGPIGNGNGHGHAAATSKAPAALHLESARSSSPIVESDIEQRIERAASPLV